MIGPVQDRGHGQPAPSRDVGLALGYGTGCWRSPSPDSSLHRVVQRPENPLPKRGSGRARTRPLSKQKKSRGRFSRSSAEIEPGVVVQRNSPLTSLPCAARPQSSSQSDVRADRRGEHRRGRVLVKRPWTLEPVSYDEWPDVPRNPDALKRPAWPPLQEKSREDMHIAASADRVSRSACCPSGVGSPSPTPDQIETAQVCLIAAKEAR